MLHRFLLTGLLGLSCVSSAMAATSPSTYHLVRKISLPGGEGWDYISSDDQAHRLFVSRSTYVQVVDTTTGTLVGTIPNTSGVHGIAIDDKAQRGFISDGRANSVTVFSLKSLATIVSVPVGNGPDCIIFDPATQRVFTFDGRDDTSTAIDAKTGKVLGAIKLPGRPEFAVSDGMGNIYDNLEDKSEIVRINSNTLQVEAVWPLAPGESPSGLAMDPKSRRLFSVCDNQKMVVLDADTGKVIATPTIGNGPDACAFDPKSGIIFSPNGEDGTLTEMHQDSPNNYSVIATLNTQRGARTIALDKSTDHIFTVMATPQTPPPGTVQGRRRTYTDGTFVVLEYAP